MHKKLSLAVSVLILGTFAWSEITSMITEPGGVNKNLQYHDNGVFSGVQNSQVNGNRVDVTSMTVGVGAGNARSTWTAAGFETDYGIRAATASFVNNSSTWSIVTSSGIEVNTGDLRLRSGSFLGDGSKLTGMGISTGVTTTAALTGNGQSSSPLGVDSSSVAVKSGGYVRNSELDPSSVTKQGFVALSNLSGAVPSGRVDFSTITTKFNEHQAALDTKLSSGAIPAVFVNLSTVAANGSNSDITALTGLANGGLKDGVIYGQDIAASTITTNKLNSSGASSGQVITYNGTDVVWGSASGGDCVLQSSRTANIPTASFTQTTLVSSIAGSTITLSGVTAGSLGRYCLCAAIDNSTIGNYGCQPMLDGVIVPVKGSSAELNDVIFGSYANAGDETFRVCGCFTNEAALGAGTRVASLSCAIVSGAGTGTLYGAGNSQNNFFIFQEVRSTCAE